MSNNENNLNIEPENIDINSDENISGTTHLNDEIADTAQIEELEAALAAEKDKYVRLAAEFDNFKRRNAKERIELMQTAGKDVIIDMLEVLDDWDRAQKAAATGNDEGVQLVFTKLKNKLESRGLKEMKAIGEEFNPDIHEAITEIPVTDDKQRNKIIDEVVKGYYLNDKIIRYAKVVVGK